MRDEEYEAGAALDALVAQLVMGKSRNCPLDPRDSSDPCRHFPRYSTNIEAAMRVINKMVGSLEIQRQNGIWKVMLSQPSQQWWAYAPTLQLAICRAALATLR